MACCRGRGGDAAVAMAAGGAADGAWRWENWGKGCGKKKSEQKSVEKGRMEDGERRQRHEVKGRMSTKAGVQNPES